MSTHTPGPWKVVNSDIATEDGKFTIAFVTNIVGVPTQANARLIAAAPEMLAALRRAQTFIRNGVAFGYIRMPDPDVPDTAHETPRLIDAAIAKAERT